MGKVLLCIALLAAVSAPSSAALTVPGADGSDGVFNPTANVTIDLSEAAVGSWDSPSPTAGKGIYDGAKWAVVFKYSEVSIPSGVTVTFKNRSPNAPVVWLVSGNVTINGTVSLNGSSGSQPGALNAPGPGGFHGGYGKYLIQPAISGFGPGGAITPGPWNVPHGGSYGTDGSSETGLTYGNAAILPLIGGSGGSGRSDAADAGGGGGGAILIACANTITIGGTLRANGYRPGYGGGGSGGAVRLVCDTYTIGGSVEASSESIGGEGRIRIEAAHGSSSGAIQPAASYGAPSTPAQIWPAEHAPSVRVAQIAGLSVPSDPKAGFEFPNQDVALTAEQPVTIRVEAANVPLDWIVRVRLGPLSGTASWITAGFVSGDATASVWEAQAQLPKGFTAVQARAAQP